MPRRGDVHIPFFGSPQLARVGNRQRARLNPNWTGPRPVVALEILPDQNYGVMTRTVIVCREASAKQPVAPISSSQVRFTAMLCFSLADELVTLECTL